MLSLLELFWVLNWKIAISLLIYANNIKIVAWQNYGGYFQFSVSLPFYINNK